MSNYKFSANQRYAIYTVHKEKCYLCQTPIDLQSMEVDHIIPESLLKDPDRLSDVLEQYGLDDSFDLNCPENWLPACERCNRQKSATVFPPTPIIQLHLVRAKNEAQRVSELIEKSVGKAQITKALNLLERANKDGNLTDEHKRKLQPLLAFHVAERDHELANQPIKVTPLYTVLREEDDRLIIQGPAGIGVRPKGTTVHHSWDCPHCGSIAAWSGARCVICGMMDDGD
jgi:5-methylcytosine-specific restriction endonuclease McrA